jgi:diguanylate cyclase (GGDEF)-like protein
MPAMAYPPTEISPHEARRPRREARNRAFDVLLQFFANSLGADTALLLKGENGGRPRVLAAWGRDGLEPAIPWVRGSFLGRALRPDAEIAVARDLPPPANGDGASAAVVATAAPVRSHDGGLGALYAGFSVAPALADEEIAWIANSYARLASLCIQSPDGLAAVLASSSWDELTGCLDYRNVTDALVGEVLRSQRHGHRLSCCFIDLDGFKSLNDSRGHLEGNRVLAALGGALMETGRRYDAVGRFGGDEFLIVLPETGGRAAQRVADRLLATARAAVAEATDSELDVSVGVAEWSSGDSANELLEAADAALREAKERGGGCVVLQGAPPRRFDGLVDLAREVARGPADRPSSAGPEITGGGRAD